MSNNEQFWMNLELHSLEDQTWMFNWLRRWLDYGQLKLKAFKNLFGGMVMFLDRCQESPNVDLAVCKFILGWRNGRLNLLNKFAEF